MPTGPLGSAGPPQTAENSFSCILERLTENWLSGPPDPRDRSPHSPADGASSPVMCPRTRVLRLSVSPRPRAPRLRDRTSDKGQYLQSQGRSLLGDPQNPLEGYPKAAEARTRRAGAGLRGRPQRQTRSPTRCDSDVLHVFKLGVSNHKAQLRTVRVVVPLVDYTETCYRPLHTNKPTTPPTRRTTHAHASFMRTATYTQTIN